MSASARVVVKCDRRGCGAEFVYSGSYAVARRAAVRNGWHSGRSMADMRQFADYCPEHVPARGTGNAPSRVSG